MRGLADLLAKFTRMVRGTASNTAGTDKSKILVAEQLLMPTDNAFRCPACNTLVHGEGFDPRQMAEEMVRQQIAHVPQCVLGM